MVDLSPSAQSELGLFLDIHDGSYLQKGVSTVYRDRAVRRGFIDGKKLFDWLGEKDGSTITPNVHTDHSQLRRAVETALQPFLHGTGPGGETIHPTAVPPLPLAFVRAWKWGPHAYFELHYANTPATLLQEAAAVTATYHGTYDHSLSFHRVQRGPLTTPNPTFLHGIPHGDIDVPDDLLGPTVKENRPRGRVWKKAAMRMYIHTILNQHPFVLQPLSAQWNVINLTAWDVIGTSTLPFTFQSGFVRYDGPNVKWLAKDRIKVSYQFTIVEGGFFGQVARFGVDPTPGGVNPGWYTDPDEPRHRFVEFAGLFPVAV